MEWALGRSGKGCSSGPLLPLTASALFAQFRSSSQSTKESISLCVYAPTSSFPSVFLPLSFSSIYLSILLYALDLSFFLLKDFINFF